MATVSITRTSGGDIYLPEIYRSISNGETLTFTRRPTEVPLLSTILVEEANSRMSVTVTLSADEMASSLTTLNSSVNATDLAPVAAATALSTVGELRFVVATGGSATVTLSAVGALPKIRVLDAQMYVSTTPGASTAVLRTEAAAGTVIATFDTGTTGKKEDVAATGSVLVTPGAGVGLFLVRSANTIVGEVVVKFRYES